MEVVNLSDATVTINPRGNVANKVAIPCISGEITFSFGSRKVDTFECHSGVQKDTGPLEYGDGSFSVTFDADNLEASQTMLIAAIDHTGDFASDKVMHIEVEHNNSKGVNGSKLAFDVLVTDVPGKDPIGGRGTLEVKYTQVSKPVITPAA